MSIFSDLEGMGLGQFKDVNVFEDKQKEMRANNAESGENAKPIELTEKDVLFDKTYKCPICDFENRCKTVKIGKAKSLGHDTDLRPRYELCDPLKYDAIVCEKCGFAALSRYFTPLTAGQMRAIKEKVTKNFKGIDNNKELYTYDDAIIRYKLALVSCLVKGSKYSERAYTCLKLGWMIRGKLEEIDDNDVRKTSLISEEHECLTNAYEGFMQAFTNENFPICGMDEPTVTYLVADLAFRLGKYEDSARMLGRVLISKTANQRIKNEAFDLKERIKEAIK